jgi:hypothetical protein
MTGDLKDFSNRLRAVLPAPWFNEPTPILSGILAGFADSWQWLYGLLIQLRLQTRIQTATGDWLDRVAADFYGGRLRRLAAESDDALRSRLQHEMRRERGTRAAVSAKLLDVTGRPPLVIEPTNPGDTGAWGHGCAWGVAGVWGSWTLPNQFFLTAFRPTTGGPQVSDETIRAAVLDALPVASIAWMQILN